jgi:crotonobetainyl-CoA:carnitine CoA-transferase CaiB-like acyl-CoA transferase
MIQAMSGLMSITGFPSNGPTRVGFAGADVMSGFTGAFGVASALYQRTHTGRGQLVDVAMIDAVTGFLAQQFTEHMMTGRVHEQAQNLSVTRKPTGNLFRTGDGWMVLAVMTDPQFQRLMKTARPRDATADPQFKDWPTRIANNKALHEIIEEAMKQRTSAEWSRDLRQERHSRRPRATIPETVKLDHFGHRTIMQTVETEHGPITVVGSGFRMEHDGGSVERPPREARRAYRRGAGRGGLFDGRDRGNADGEGRLIGPCAAPIVQSRDGRRSAIDQVD